MASSARYRWVIAHQEEEARRDQDIETMTGELDLRGQWGDPPEPTASVPASERHVPASERKGDRRARRPRRATPPPPPRPPGPAAKPGAASGPARPTPCAAPCTAPA